MALLPARPKIRVRVPNEIRPGEELVAAVLLECKREVRVERVDVTFEGVESWIVPGQGGARQVDLLRLGARLSEARKLKKGRTGLPVRIPLPLDIPASYVGTHARIEYVLRVKVTIDWWPDATGSFEIKIVPREVASPETKPGIYASNTSGPRTREPHVELSVAATWTRAGDFVRGAFALSNVAHNQYTGVTIGLRAMESYTGGQGPWVESTGYQIHVSTDGLSEGEMRPFGFRLPDDMAPDFSSRWRPSVVGYAALAHYLELTASVRWGSDLRIRVPFTVLPRSERPGDAPPRLAPPSVGEDRLRTLWEAVGAPHGMSYQAHTLVGRYGETEVSIRRDHRGREGLYLVASLRYPAIHLDLSVARERTLLSRDVRIGDAAFDEAHTVHARDASQAAAFVRPLLPSIRGATLRRIDDSSLTLDVRDAGQSRTTLEGFVSATAALARQLDAVRNAIPPPAALREAHPGWQDLAATVNGALETARMRIEGQLGGIAFLVRAELDDRGQPQGTFLAITPSAPLDDQHCFAWTAADSAETITARFSGDLGDLVRVVASETAELRIEPDQIALALSGMLGLEVAPATAERKLERMVQLANVLRGQVGPYR